MNENNPFSYSTLDVGSPYVNYDLAIRDDEEFIWRVNGEELEDSMAESVFEWIDTSLRNVRQCPFCRSAMQTRESLYYPNENEIAEADVPNETAHRDIFHEATLKVCPRCLYWHWFSGGIIRDSWPGGAMTEWAAALSKIRTFENSLPEGCLSEFSQLARRNPALWREIAPVRLEKLVAEIWRANHQSCEVFHVGGTNDDGLDVLFIDAGNKQWLIQVKRRAQEKKAESVSTIRNLLGTMLLRNAQLGAVVSIADHFSFRAMAAVKKAERLGFTIKLVDRESIPKLVELCEASSRS